jgi:tetratricopeptide (TPR) repeat protein
MRYLLLSLLCLMGTALPCEAGLYYSGEKLAELPSQWRGFLADLRMLRLAAVPPGAKVAESALRQRYTAAAAELQAKAKKQPLTADEAADLGALLVRLGQVGEALEVLREAQRQHPQHFALAANLGTAWQANGDLSNAAMQLRLACDLAPAKLRPVEELHLQLVRRRLRQKTSDQSLDDLFGVKWVNEQGKYEPGQLAAAERKKIPEGALAMLQRLALWLPADGRLIWQLGELAAVYGDLRSAADLLEICIGEFGLNEPTLFQHKAVMKAAYEAFLQQTPRDLDSQKVSHAAHGGTGIAFKSRTPLVKEPLDLRALPAINKNGPTPLVWPVLQETQRERGQPSFPQYLRELDGRQVTLIGYMQPLFDELDTAAFLAVENSTGCWYCEMPSLNGMVLVELPEGKSIRLTRDPLKITGRLKLNSNDPENFLFSLVDATVSGLE